MSVFVLCWIRWNTLAPDSLRWDHYPFIFLTLLLSLQDSYAAPLILLAQNRQADRDRIQANEDRDRDERNIADTEYLARELLVYVLLLVMWPLGTFLRTEIADAMDELIKKIKDQK
jgi:uncharacterized membrane protein